ncbi:MAG TPA: AraC family transcriptional regulator [Vicinamibacterales bacterium]|jgi:AraC family transcriptional regulator|nr:AraC family transcriptional regulator [Vicinamibacterales bacterium]
MSSNMVRDGRQSASRPLASFDDAPVKHLRLKEPSSIPSQLRGADAFTITRLDCSCGLAQPITKVSTVPALLVAVSTTSVASADYEFRVDDKRVPTPYIHAFRSTVMDLDARPSCWIRRPFGYLLFHVPLKGLDDIAADLGVGTVETYKVAVAEEDLVLAQLTKSMLPSVGRPDWPSPLALDHLNLILGAHVLQKYGALRKPASVSVGGLGPSQKRRATELLNENLTGGIRLSQVAEECGLSISHFARSFKASFGVSTHRWLVLRRIERSQDLLIHTRESLSDIAEQAGFADQAAFTRTFHQIVGTSPGRWRRDHQRR